MTLSQFITKYLGKQVEYHSFNPNAKYQCVDLANAYIKEILGLTPIIGTDAKDMGSKASKTEFDWIPNTPTGVPQPGDIVIWNSKVGGGAGHIAIFLDGDANSFTALSQNDPIGRETHLKKYNYNSVLGWLHPKKGTMANMYKGYDLANPESMKVAVDVLVRLQSGELIEKSKHEQLLSSQQLTLIREKDQAVGEAYARGLKECEAKPTTPDYPPTAPDMTNWELNGMEITTGNITRNYKLKA